jgi:hypothetical protein
VLRLANLTREDLFVLLEKLRHVFAYGDPAKYLVPDSALHAFMEHCSKRIGDAYFRTPRNTITAFVNLLAVLEQNPGADWKSLLGSVAVEADNGALAERASDDSPSRPSGPHTGGEDDLATFKL